jgi:glutaredoxin
MRKWSFFLIATLLFIILLFFGTVMSGTAFTLLYSGEEHGQLGLHGCGSEQVGGLAHRHTLISDLRTDFDAVLNLHTGNLIDATDENAEWVYQIGLSALDAMDVDVLCLGPNELSFTSETLAALHANHPKIAFTCANLKREIESPYLIQAVSSMNVAVVGLISETYAQELHKVELTQPHIALAELKAELVSKSDFVVVVFHATQDEAQTLAEAMPWIDVLIVANDEQPATLSCERLPCSKETAIVTNATQGAAVGMLTVKINKERQAQAGVNRYHNVSEKITPNVNISHLLEAYQALTTSESFDTAGHQESDNAIHITYFHKHGCQKCARAVKVLKRLKEKYPQIVVDQRNAKTEQTLFEAMGTLYDVPEIKRLTTPAVFVGDTALIGELNEQGLENAIQKHLRTGVTSRLKEAETQIDTAETEIVNRFHGFGILTVAGAGLLDGINPCAFATIVFFISYMNLVGRGRKEMLIAGGAFALAVFGTYLLLGLGMLSFMSYLNQYSGIAKCVYLLAATATFALAGLSLYDAVKAKQGKTKDILLQLPRALKQRIHKVIREQTRTSGVIAGAMVIGFIISALELVCTGQVYLPTLTFVAGIEGMRAHAISYLLLYNIMFIVPLIVVFGCVYWGTTSMQLGGILQKHLVSVKVGIGLLLFGLGIWLVLSVV